MTTHSPSPSLLRQSNGFIPLVILLVAVVAGRSAYAADADSTGQDLSVVISGLYPGYGIQFAQLLASSLPDTVRATMENLPDPRLVHGILCCTTFDSVKADGKYTPRDVACVASDDWTTLYLAVFRADSTEWNRQWSTVQPGPLMDPSIASAHERVDGSGSLLLLFHGRSGMRGAATVLVSWRGTSAHVMGRIIGMGPLLMDADDDGQNELSVLNGGWGLPYTERIYRIDTVADSLYYDADLKSERLGK